MSRIGAYLAKVFVTCAFAAMVLAVPVRGYAAAIYTFNSANYMFAEPPYTTAMHLQFTMTLDNLLPAGTLSTNVSR